MKKIISTLLTIILFQLQVFSISAQPISVLLSVNNSVINNSVSLPCLPTADSHSSVIPAEQLSGNLSETNTTQSLSKLNRNISTTQELTKSQTTRALNINTTIDLRWLTTSGRKDILTALKNAPKNAKKSTKNLIKDIKTTVSKTEEIIKQTITKQTKDELTKNVDKIEFSKNKQENKKIKDKILQNEKLAKLQTAIDNIKVLEEYLKNNSLDNQTIEKLKELGASGEYSYVIGISGELFVCGYEYKSKVIDDNNIQMTLSIIKALDEKFLNQESKGTYKEILSNTISDATTSIQIAVGSSKEIQKIGKDTNEVIEDTKELIKEIAKSSKDENTYEIAKETIKNLPKNIEWTITTVATNISNIENLQALGYKIGSKIYEYKETPLSLLEDTASILTSYDLYKTGLTEENIFYATGLIVGGLVLDVSGTPLKAGKEVAKTARATEKIVKKVDFYVKPTGEVIPATGYRYMDSSQYQKVLQNKQQYATYVGFEKYDSAKEVQDKFQIIKQWSDAKVRGSFDTLQVVDKLYIPTEKGNTTKILEPFTHSYPQYGKGGEYQMRIDDIIKFDKIELIGD